MGEEGGLSPRTPWKLEGGRRERKRKKMKRKRENWRKEKGDEVPPISASAPGDHKHAHKSQ